MTGANQSDDKEKGLGLPSTTGAPPQPDPTPSRNDAPANNTTGESAGDADRKPEPEGPKDRPGSPPPPGPKPPPAGSKRTDDADPWGSDAKHAGTPSAGAWRSDPASLPADKGPDRDAERVAFRRLQEASRGKKRALTSQLEQVCERLEEIAAPTSDDDKEIVVLGVRSAAGVPTDLLASCFASPPAQAFVRSDAGEWAVLKRTGLRELYEAFAAAAGQETDGAVFIDRIPCSQLGGDIERIVKDTDDLRFEVFRNELRRRNFRIVLLVIVDDPRGMTAIREDYPLLQPIPWADLWLEELADKHALTRSALRQGVGDDLRAASEWNGYSDDARERLLFDRLRDVLGGSFTRNDAAAIGAIKDAIEKARRPDGDQAEEAARAERLRLDLASTLGGPGQAADADPIKRIMLTVAAFAVGVRVDVYDAVCRKLLPEGEAETGRLPRAVREELRRAEIEAQRLRSKRVVTPGWAHIFDVERDALRAELGIQVGDGQAIQLDNRWSMLDLKREIARSYPGLVHSILGMIGERQLFIEALDGEATALTSIICSIRDACGAGFDDSAIAFALTGAGGGDNDLLVPRVVVQRLFPGFEPEDLLELARSIDHGERYSDYLRATTGQADPDLERRLAVLRGLFPEATPENVAWRLAQWRAELREVTVRRLTHHLVNMRRSSTAASEERRPIIPSMLDILRRTLTTPINAALLANLLATAPEVDVPDIGRRLVREFTQAPNPEAIEILGSIKQWLERALNQEKAPHLNWLVAFDPIREGKAADDRIRALAVYVWDIVMNYDVLGSFADYSRMKHLRVVRALFRTVWAFPGARVEEEPSFVDVGAEDAMLQRIVDGFFAQDPADWLRALHTLGTIFDGDHGFQPVRYVEARLADIAWVVMAGADERDRSLLEERKAVLARDVLLSLTASIRAGFEGDFGAVAWRVVNAIESPSDRFESKWLELYGLFWPAMLAHWRFTAFGVEPFEPGSEPDRRFRSLLDRIATAAPARMPAYRDGFGALARTAEQCAIKAQSMRAEATANRYRRKANRLRGLAIYFAARVRSLPVEV